jgi:hypothetical protein
VGRSAAIALALGILAAAGWRTVLWMPGAARPPACSALDVDLAALERELGRHVRALAGDIGPRWYGRPEALDAAAQYVERALAIPGWEVGARVFGREREFRNAIAERPGAGRAGEIVLVGAHYDSVAGSPGADDNASGVAALLELARLLGPRPSARTLRLIAFTNEERPLGETELAGSRVAARDSRERGEAIAAMLALEGLGVYADAPGSQRHPWPLGAFFPDRGDFLAWIGDLRSRALLHDALAQFRASGRLPSQGIAVPAVLVPDIRRSDHAAYWAQRYAALLVTDTSEFRDPNYHGPGDLPERLDYRRMALAVAGVAEVVACLAAGQTASGPAR